MYIYIYIYIYHTVTYYTRLYKCYIVFVLNYCLPPRDDVDPLPFGLLSLL